jgi:ATP-dependent DNA ligase
MLLLRTDSLPNDGDRWQYQLKFDGYRAIVFKTGGKVHLRSRNDNDFRSLTFATILASLAHRRAVNLHRDRGVGDGEDQQRRRQQVEGKPPGVS